MNITIGELDSAQEETRGGVGALQTPKGNLPLHAIAIETDVTALSSRTVMTQKFHNPHTDPIEATYIFPLPERAATTDMVFTTAQRTVTAQLKERGQARHEYDQAISQGKQAAVAESERDDVFTMRVGNIPPGETAEVTLTFVGPLAVDDNEATLRLPLVVAPRFIPGASLDGPAVGSGYAADTDAVADASRITPPILLPGFPNPIDLSIKVNVDPSGLELRGAQSSLHTVVTDETEDGRVSLRIQPGERVNRDFILRLAYGSDNTIDHTLTTVADAHNHGEGTFALTVLAPNDAGGGRARDVVVLVDRSGSMKGWKMVAARRFAARIIDTLGEHDRFAVRCFDSDVTSPDELGDGLSPATDSNRFAAVEFLSNTQARGGTRMLGPLTEAAELMDGSAGDNARSIVVVTDGQVGNEDQIVSKLHHRLESTRVHTIGIDTAVNAGFLHRLALLGHGRCELVESPQRLDEAAAKIHRRIATPVVTGVEIAGETATIEAITPEPVSDLFAGVPLRVWGRYRDASGAPLRVAVGGVDADGAPWRVQVDAHEATDPVVSASWARSRLRDLTDRYAAADPAQLDELEKQIVDTSLQNGVLCRFTAFIAVNSAVVVEDGQPRTVVQPVELPHGWQMEPRPQAQPRLAAGSSTLMAMPASFGSGPSRGAAAGSGKTARFSMSPSTRAPRGHKAKVQPVAQLQAIAAAELQFMRGVSADERERRDALSDMAARLKLVVEEQHWDVEPEALEPLRQLVPALAECDATIPPRGEALEALWQRAMQVWESLSRDHAPRTQEQASRAAARDEAGFWKRRRQ